MPGLALVFGATGYIGSQLEPRLQASGVPVRAAARTLETLEARPWSGVDRVAADALRPETLAQPAAGRGWRIVRLMQGYEAQLWREKALVASAWRRDRYDAAAWSAFVRLQRNAEAAPEAPPAPSDLPIAFDNRDAFALTPVELSREQLALMVGGGAACASLCVAAFLFGQSRELAKDVARVEAETAEIRAATPQAEAVHRLNASQQKLVAYRRLEEQTGPLSAAGAAIGILALHDLAPSALNAETETLEFTLPYEAIGKIALVVGDLESSGYFYAVEPRTDSAARNLSVKMRVREAAPPLEPEPGLEPAPASPAQP
jgi:hypothetical protein